MIFPLVGNNSVKQTVENALGQNRLPHAIIIDGDDGVGKQKLAAFLAKAAVCEGQGAPCGACGGCHLADVGSHPDIAVISPEQGKKSISVAQARALRSEAYVKAHMAWRRVFIINRADQMNEQAQNALLKVLEEPPADVVFILITRSRAALLSTVLSRCVLLALAVPERAQAIEYLAESTDKSKEEICDALNSAGGNVGVAQDILSSGRKSDAGDKAKEFLELFLEDRKLEMLKMLHPLEKDRAATEEFFGELQLCILSRLRSERLSGKKARMLASLFEDVKGYEQLLKTNANLSVLFGCLVCKAK